jgi:hypothetical protein
VIRLPETRARLPEWPLQVMQRWVDLTERVARTSEQAGRSTAFERMVRVLREMVRSNRFEGLDDLLAQRPAARALTWLWLTDEAVRRRLLSASLLDALLELQAPRLSRMSLMYLVTLYFREFDRLDSLGRGPGLRAHLQRRVLEQVGLLPEFASVGGRPDPLRTLKQQGAWLLALDGPLQLARQTSQRGAELGETLSALGLSGIETGRYGDICRAHFYLNTLQELAPGQWHPVLDELLKPQVAKAPYKGELRIGHAALAILIDRSSADPGERWQSWILSLAGDPRISSRARSFAEWWRPLGEARIEKVRGWLSKEDLRLFLQALEQYGHESGKADLQRMFPARKVFLEGLYRLGLVRTSRLMLGSTAQAIVRRILGKDLMTSFAKLTGAMSDKAVIYLDCGEFCLVEGSHSFKIWVYLEPPSARLVNYEINEFSHSDLTVGVPADYERSFPDYYYTDVVHSGPWQWKVFDFLADNGIELDIEQLMTREDYRQMLSSQGRPVVRSAAVRQKQSRLAARGQTRSRAELPDILEGESANLANESGATGADSAGRRSADRSPARPSDPGASRQASLPLPPAGAAAVGRSGAEPGDGLSMALMNLATLEHEILRYFLCNPRERARGVAHQLQVEVRDINRALHGNLAAMVEQDEQHGWTLRPEVARALTELEG